MLKYRRVVEKLLGDLPNNVKLFAKTIVFDGGESQEILRPS